MIWRTLMYKEEDGEPYQDAVICAVERLSDHRYWDGAAEDWVVDLTWNGMERLDSSGLRRIEVSGAEKDAAYFLWAKAESAPPGLVVLEAQQVVVAGYTGSFEDVSELDIIERFVYGALVNDADVAEFVGDRIYSPIGLGEPEAPYITFQNLAPGDVNGVGATRLAVRGKCLVVAVGTTGQAEVGRIARAIDEVLHGRHEEIDGGWVYSCIRDEPFGDHETVDGVTWYRRGGIYALMVHQ